MSEGYPETLSGGPDAGRHDAAQRPEDRDHERGTGGYPVHDAGRTSEVPTFEGIVLGRQPSRTACRGARVARSVPAPGESRGLRNRADDLRRRVPAAGDEAAGSDPRPGDDKVVGDVPYMPGESMPPQALRDSPGTGGGLPTFPEARPRTDGADVDPEGEAFSGHAGPIVFRDGVFQIDLACADASPGIDPDLKRLIDSILDPCPDFSPSSLRASDPGHP